MEIEWKYKIELKDKKIFEKIGKERKIAFPKELERLIKTANAATPSKYRFMIGNNERDFGAVLSFNQNEKDTDTVFAALEVITDANFIPFGIDPFGNYICYSVKDKAVVFWNHETDMVTLVNNSLAGFLDSLY